MKQTHDITQYLKKMKLHIFLIFVFSSTGFTTTRNNNIRSHVTPPPCEVLNTKEQLIQDPQEEQI